MNHRQGTLALLGSLALLAGCDDGAAPPPVDERPPAEPAPQPPTTQALLEGPRKVLHLELIPFSIEVPASWKLSMKQSDSLPITLVEGPMPVEQAVISVHMRETVTGSILKTWLDRVAKEDAELRPRGGSVTLREMGEAYVIERRRPFSPTTQPTTTPTTMTSQPQGSMEWRLTILTPRGLKYDWYELKVLGLTDELYRQNEKFLSGVLQSLKPATPPPLPPM